MRCLKPLFNFCEKKTKISSLSKEMLNPVEVLGDVDGVEIDVMVNGNKCGCHNLVFNVKVSGG